MNRLLKTLLTFFGASLFVISNAQADGDYIVHTIKKGEIMPVLAKKYGITVEDITKLNNFGATHILHVGDKVKLPANAVYREVPDSILASSRQEPAVKQPTVVKQQAEPKQPVVNVGATANAPAYTMHTVEKGEIFSVLAKKYGVTVDDILKANNFNRSHIPHVGDKIKLPANAASQQPAAEPPVTAAKQAGPEAKPETPLVDTTASVTHTVLKKETLYSIGKKYKVTVAQLKAWNSLTSNNISEGQALVIRGVSPNVQDNAVSQQAVTYPSLPQEPAKKITAPPVVTSSPAEKLTLDEKVSSSKPVAEASPANIPETGYFSSGFGKDVAGRSLQTANGAAMLFKTASGWNDKKYYVLMDNVPPGSIVQVTNEDGKAIYAKVLWNLGDTKEDGITFRISDAAASVLNLKGTKFQIAVTYYQ